MNFAVSEQEKRLIKDIFAKANTQDYHYITRDHANEVFAGFGLPSITLDKIWAIADTDGNQFLTENELVAAIKLIGWAQNNMEPTQELLTLAAPAPTLKGISPPGFSFNPNPRPTVPHSFNATPPVPRNSAAIPPRPYEQGRTSMPVPSSSSHVPNQWTGESNGHPIYTEPISGFTSHAGMFPASRPPLSSQDTTDSSSRIAPQYSNPPRFEAPSRSRWNVSTEEKAEYNAIFAHLDSQKRGSIDGNVAAEYMRRTGIPDSTLGQIWDEVDRNRDGELAPDEFALAMHIMRKVTTSGRTSAEPPTQVMRPELGMSVDPASHPWRTMTTLSTSALPQTHESAATPIAQSAMSSPPYLNRDTATPTPEIMNLRNHVLAQRTRNGDLAKAREATLHLRSEIKAAQHKREQACHDLNKIEALLKEAKEQTDNTKTELLRLTREANHFTSLLQTTAKQLSQVQSEKDQLSIEIGRAKESPNSEWPEPTAIQELPKAARHYAQTALILACSLTLLAWSYLYARSKISLI
ncbi:EH domain-containing and endocytosis protein 1 [Ceratobasidium sp. AG-Ba]|nr:EH domain-containing and endocytosis protein 1 [Ceratobasidium sp. AG-Ba]